MIEEPDFISEGGFIIFSESYLIKQGLCCGCGCLKCPYEPPFINGNGQIRKELKDRVILKIDLK